MSRRTIRAIFLVLSIAPIVGACAGSEPLAGAPEPTIGEPADAVEVAVAEPAVVRERDAPPRDRWRAPFAVSSSGQAEPIRPRSIVVVGSDPAIAAGLNEQRAIDLGAAAGSDRDVPPRAANRNAGNGGDVTSPARPAPSRARGDVPPRDSRIEVADDSPDDDDAPTPEGPSAEVNTRNHVVLRGDSWLGIAARYRVSTSALADANPNVDPERIRIGQRIMIPAGAADEERSRVHRVAPGETLSEIAERYSVPQLEIRRANNLTDDRIRVGQTLSIPPGN